MLTRARSDPLKLVLRTIQIRLSEPSATRGVGSLSHVPPLATLQPCRSSLQCTVSSPHPCQRRRYVTKAPGGNDDGGGGGSGSGLFHSSRYSPWDQVFTDIQESPPLIARSGRRRHAEGEQGDEQSTSAHRGRRQAM